MKTLIVGALFSWASAACAAPISIDALEAAWEAGAKAQILAAGRERVDANPADPVGLLLLLSYHAEFVNLNELPGIIRQLKAVGPTVSGAHFSAIWPLTLASIESLERAISHADRANLERDRQKANLLGKPIPFLSALIAASEDGLVAK